MGAVTCEKAKSSRSSCKVCNAKIEKGTWRIVASVYSPFGNTNRFMHPLCCMYLSKAPSSRFLCSNMHEEDRKIKNGELIIRIKNGNKENSAGDAKVHLHCGIQNLLRPLEIQPTALHGFSSLSPKDKYLLTRVHNKKQNCPSDKKQVVDHRINPKATLKRTIEPLSMYRKNLKDRFLKLTKESLPRLSRKSDMKFPIHLDHCFQRVILDNIFKECWYNRLDRKKGAINTITNVDLEKAIKLAESILQNPESIISLNRFSLNCRGKQKQPEPRSEEYIQDEENSLIDDDSSRMTDESEYSVYGEDEDEEPLVSDELECKKDQLKKDGDETNSNTNESNKYIEGEVNEYEQQRLRNLERNEIELQKLGVGVGRKHNKVLRKVIRNKRTLETERPLLRSKRLKGLNPDGSPMAKENKRELQDSTGGFIDMKRVQTRRARESSGPQDEPIDRNRVQLSSGPCAWKWAGRLCKGMLLKDKEDVNYRYARTQNGKIKTLKKGAAYWWSISK